MDDLKLMVGLDGSLWVSHADDVDAVPTSNGFFIYDMKALLTAVRQIEEKVEYRFAKVRVRVQPTRHGPIIPQPPVGKRP